MFLHLHICIYTYEIFKLNLYFLFIIFYSILASFHMNEKEHSDEQFKFRDMKGIRKRRNTMSNNSL
ncbi:hypothetical protein PFFCH_01420 [Plasmodium falciparum FCH/4]|uniref:Uncharacterized protein n=1 Tax=Plasmodium falciparum FCH/4 TaxID=1036724 RepID=A0A024VRR5_PLAFA|nr:hypothetical protein PFFCH_01420 [Plasmodium falciparum FCH/4]